MMLLSDMILAWDPSFRTHLEDYADDEELLKREFGAAFKKLTELGCEKVLLDPVCRRERRCRQGFRWQRCCRSSGRRCWRARHGRRPRRRASRRRRHALTRQERPAHVRQRLGPNLRRHHTRRRV